MLDYLGQNESDYHLETQKVQIYVRNVQKQARIFTVSSTIWPQDFLHVVSSKFNIPTERIILYYNGYRIDNYSLSISLIQKSIIHLIDKENLKQDNINVTFNNLFNSPVLKFSFHPNTQISLILSNYLAPQYGIDANKFFIVHAGKTLNSLNTLKDQYVQNGAEVIVVKFKSINDSFQKQAIQYNSSYHLQASVLSSLKYMTPVSYQTSISAIKKKNLQQASFAQSNYQFLNAGPLPIINEAEANNDNWPININVPAVNVSAPLNFEQDIAPNDFLSKSDDRIQQNTVKSVKAQVNVLANTAKSAPEQLQVNNKAILQLESHYHDISFTNIEVKPILSDQKNEEDSFFDQLLGAKKNK